ncbi:hypothetical protein DK853_38705, partial [Klebsiella oxytoca]
IIVYVLVRTSISIVIMSGHDSVTKISHIPNEPVNEKVMVQNGFHESSKIADIELEIQERP